MNEGGIISENELMNKLLNSKKTIQKIETKKNTTASFNDDDEDDFDFSFDLNKNKPSNDFVMPTTLPVNKEITLEKINESKLPDSIKKLFIENGAPTNVATTTNTSKNIFENAKKIIDASIPNSKKNSKTNINELAQLIETIVRKVLDEKIEEIKNANNMVNIDENLAIKVGDSLFKGKITKIIQK